MNTTTTPSPVSPKNFWLVLINALALGALGAHRFAVGKWKSALLQLFTVGGLGLWLAFDLLTILRGKFTDASGLVIPNPSKAPSWIVSVIVVVGILSRFGHHSDSGASGASADSSASDTRRAPAIVMPAEEKAFTEAVSSFIAPYQGAENELKKSAVRARRKQNLSELVPTLEFKSWVGRLETMSTTSQGNAHLAVAIGSGPIQLKTYNNELSDTGDNTLIPINSDLFNTVADLKAGMMVMVSGTFLADEQDFIKENSLTEAGSLTAPEFIVKFTRVEKAQ